MTNDKLKPPTIKVSSREDADACLRRIGQLERLIADEEFFANQDIDARRALLVEKTQAERDERDERMAALKKWAETNKDLFKKPRTMELNFGSVGFRLTPWKIVITGKLKVETVIERLRANRMHSLIRQKPEIDRERALNYLNSDLAKVGLKKTRRDEFFFETKAEEVK